MKFGHDDHMIPPTQQEGSLRPLALDETEIPITWTWYLGHLLINLLFCLLLFGVVLLVSYYTQEDISP